MDNNNEIKKASEELKQVSGDYELRRIAELREKAIRDEHAALSFAIQKGLKQGFEQGLEQGLEQVIEKMLKDHIGQDSQKAEDMKILKDTVEKLKDSERCVLRTNILRIYNKYLPTGEIPAYEFETLSKDYHSYKGLEGNTFVDDIWEIMSKEWKVIPNGNYR